MSNSWGVLTILSQPRLIWNVRTGTLQADSRCAGRQERYQHEVPGAGLHLHGDVKPEPAGHAARAAVVLCLPGSTFLITYSMTSTPTSPVSGSLYLDDGDSLIQPTTSYLHFLYAHGKLNMTGIFRYDASVSIASVTVLDTGSNGTKTTTDIKLTGAQKNIHV
ncbi:hypothetical protein LTS02_013241 [Friedmanniomyces endolithicus]|nr:hypothetical protein LTS09_016120 [Friedmanniomyces endolithicus]KAK0850320.1 hypothetical protein LTS02_013241 [Friedmanniomyces endolithicus]